ncbi:MAG: hypothetical protein NNA18_03550 [Nitrospira sp.]|nr:hypothetical protein [Nitrospira sp.]
MGKCLAVGALVVVMMGILAAWPSDARTPVHWDTVEVVQDPYGGIRATARLLLAAKAEVIYNLPTD